MIKAIIFDCFGVIRIEAFEAVYQLFGGNVTKDLDFIKRVMYDVNSGKIDSSAPLVAKHLGISIDAWRKAINEGSTFNQKLLDYALELRKEYKVAMFTNLGRGGLQRLFEPEFLHKYFDVVVASGDIGLAKPEALSYEYVADKLGVRMDECVMIDDRQEYIDGAIGVGMKTILYVSAQQLKRDLSGILSA